MFQILTMFFFVFNFIRKDQGADTAGLKNKLNTVVLMCDFAKYQNGTGFIK